MAIDGNIDRLSGRSDSSSIAVDGSFIFVKLGAQAYIVPGWELVILARVHWRCEGRAVVAQLHRAQALHQLSSRRVWKNNLHSPDYRLSHSLLPPS